MGLRATLRVSPEKQGERPTKDRLERTAAELRGSGFDVLRVGRIGVVVSAEDEKFTKVLGVKPGASPVQAVTPSASELGDLVDQVEFVSEPTLY
jgi:hypothetical protein